MYRMRKDSHLIEGLHDLIEYVNLPYESTLVEIGSYRGESTEVWAKNFEDVTAIDPWSFIITPATMVDFINNFNQHREEIDWENLPTIFSKVEESFDERMKPYTITKLKMSSDDAIEIFNDESIDIVYIDAMHDYAAVDNDIENWIKKIKPNGFIAGHDYSERWSGVVQAIDKHFGNPDKVFKDTSWVVRKLAP